MSRGSGRFRPRPLAILAYAIVAFLYLPLVVAVLFAFNSESDLNWPPSGFSTRWFEGIFTDPTFLDAMWTSTKAAAASAVLAALLGTAAAFVFTRSRRPAARVLEPLARLPVMIPPLLIGVGLLTAMDFLNLRPGFTSVVIGQAIFVLPFVVIVILVRLSSFDLDLENAARDLGAGPFQTLRRVTLPIIAPAVLGATLLAFAFSFDETLITNFTIGQEPTLPLFILSKLRRTVDPSINAVATILLVIPWIALGLAWLALRRSRLNGIQDNEESVNDVI